MGDMTAIHHQQENSRQNLDFLVLDVDTLCLPPIKTTTTNNNCNEEMDPFADSRLHTSLSRKGGRGMEWKTSCDGTFKELSIATDTGVVPTVQDTGTSILTPVQQSWHKRRLGPSSTWLHPRKVMLFFASVSSMGTIILLYLTLSRWEE
ncbi:hypothetical protein ZOSMA_23G00780 [Zostera marina]|uniref:Uncharacterized protein n=1 Tax=Zostera marina TaxID=29655 RepID=A0A0K9PH78_ZOSMR|nr:hypothetical protein ZOSMA_23G00780 [Zostera marina]